MIVIATLLRNFQAGKDLVRLLSKKHRVRTHFDSQHIKGSKTLVKSAFSKYFFIALRESGLKNISLSDMLNLRDVS